MEKRFCTGEVIMEKEINRDEFQLVLPMCLAKKMEYYSNLKIVQTIKEFFVDNFKNEEDIMQEYIEYIPSIIFVPDIISAMIENDLLLEDVEGTVGILAKIVSIRKVIKQYNIDNEIKEDIDNLLDGLKKTFNKKNNRKYIFVSKINKISLTFLSKLYKYNLVNVARKIYEDRDVRIVLEKRCIIQNKDIIDFNIEDQSYRIILELLVSILITNAIEENKTFLEVAKKINLVKVKQKIVEYLEEIPIIEK